MNAGRGRSPESDAPLGAGSPDEPAHTLPAEPAQITKVPAAKAAGEQPSSRSGPRQEKHQEKRQGNEEPEPTLEEDLPSDGRDKKGEAMIRDLPRNVGKKEK